MKKGIIMSLLLMFLLTGCFGIAKKEPEVHIEDFRINCQNRYDQDFDEYTMMYRVTNNSKYPVTQYQYYGTINSGQDESQLCYYGTLMPGETSPIQETSDVTSINDIKVTQINYVYKDENDNDVLVIYDAKLDKYSLP